MTSREVRPDIDDFATLTHRVPDHPLIAPQSDVKWSFSPRPIRVTTDLGRILLDPGHVLADDERLPTIMHEHRMVIGDDEVRVYVVNREVVDRHLKAVADDSIDDDR